MFKTFKPFNRCAEPALSLIEGFKPSDRRRYLHWLFEAEKWLGYYVLDYSVTSNHIHLLVKDTGSNVIAESMRLILGRTAWKTSSYCAGVVNGPQRVEKMVRPH